MSAQPFITVPNAGDKTLRQFLAAQGRELGDVHREVLNEIARAISERGWVQPIDQLTAKLVDHGLAKDKVAAAIDDLLWRRLLAVDITRTRFTSLLGCIALMPTRHRARLESKVDVYTHGGMELLAVNSTLLKACDVFTNCPITDKPLKLTIANEEVVRAEPEGIAGFIAQWDGSDSLAAQAARSPLFADDDALAAWRERHQGVAGTELSGDLMLYLGMELAKQLGALRFKLLSHHA